MNDPLKVVALHDGRPSLCDVAGRLRMMAADLEARSGSENDVQTLLIVTNTTAGEVFVSCFGDVPSKYHCAGLLLSAANKHAQE